VVAFVTSLRWLRGEKTYDKNYSDSDSRLALNKFFRANEDLESDLDNESGGD